jgi:hypothetical protein
VSKRLQITRLALALLMLLMLVLPVPWAFYESGHSLIGLYFVLGSWSLIPELVAWPPHLGLPHLILLSMVAFAGGFTVLVLSILLSAALAQPWFRWVRGTLVAVTLVSALLLACVWPSSSFVDVGFWLAVGLVGIAGLIELIEYVGSRSRKSPGG